MREADPWWRELRPERHNQEHRESLKATQKNEGETSPILAVERFQLASDLIALGRPEDRAEAKQLLDQSLATLEKQSPPHQRLADVRAASASLN